MTLKIEGNKATATFTTPEGDEVTINGEIKINDTATPKTIDFVNFKRPNGEDAEDNLGITELNGDELKRVQRRTRQGPSHGIQGRRRRPAESPDLSCDRQRSEVSRRLDIEPGSLFGEEPGRLRPARFDLPKD